MKRLLITVAALGLATPTFAATQGQIGQSSVGTVDVNATIPEFVRISGLSDIQIAPTVADLTQGDGRIQGSTDMCVYSNVSAAGNYTLTVSGNQATVNGGRFFGLESAGGEELRTEARFLPTSGGFNPLRPNSSRSLSTTDGGQTRTATLDCSDVGGSNGGFGVVIFQQDYLAVPADTYSGTLTLTVATQ